ncbi:MAG: hypothetical protein ACI3VB_01440 [Oscillospiraceae bacterium]
MGTGQAFVKWLRPAGCVLFLGLFITVTVILFTAKGTPVEGYTAPQSSEYYSEHLDELAREINENLIPLLDIPWAKAERTGDVVTICAEGESLSTVRFAVIHYYDVELFEFLSSDEIQTGT